MTRYVSTTQHKELFAKVVAHMKEKGSIWAVPSGGKSSMWYIAEAKQEITYWYSNLESHVMGRCNGPGWDLLPAEDVPLYLAEVANGHTSFTNDKLTRFIIAGLATRLELGV